MSTVSATVTPAVELSDTRPRQGSVVSVRGSDATCRPTLRWNGESINLQESNGTLVGYFGVGLETEPGRKNLVVNRRCPGFPDTERLTVQIRSGEYPVQRLTVEDTGKVSLSEADLRRHRRESRLIDEALNRRTNERYWSPPFHPPVQRRKFEPGDSFGSRRIINGKPRSPHSGEDYDADVGDPIYAINDGKVVLTGDFFFSGKGVFVDHGHGLVSMYFHLSKIAVEEGEFVQSGDRIGSAGATGRVTGPHLHLGIQWRGATVDPDQFFFSQSNHFTSDDSTDEPTDQE